MLREVFGKVLRDYREESSMTLRALSRRSGISASYLSEVENAKKDASSEILEDICGGLGLNTLDLLEMAAQMLARVEDDNSMCYNTK